MGTGQMIARGPISFRVNFFTVTDRTSSLTYDFFLKTTTAMGVLIPQARGAKNYTLVGRYLQLGIILYLIAYIPTAAIWSIYTKDAVLWFGFDQETAAIARKYAYPFIVEDAIAGISGALEEFLITTDHVRFATLMSIGFDALEFTTLFIMALAGIHDLFLIGTTIVLLQFLYFVAIFAMVLHFGWLNKYWEGLFLTNSFKVCVRARVSLFCENTIFWWFKPILYVCLTYY